MTAVRNPANNQDDVAYSTYSYRYRIGTAEQNRLADSIAIDELGLNGFTLMETAGLQTAMELGYRLSAGSTGIYLCGKGNNGGDGLVVARYLALRENHICHIFFPGGTDSLSDETEQNLKILKVLSNEMSNLHLHKTGIEKWPADESFDYIVDAMLGTGLNSTLREPFSSAVKWANGRPELTCSMDIPTGLNADSGQVMGSTVKADLTLTFGMLKTGFFFPPGPEFCGEIVLIPLSFPDNRLQSTASLLAPEQLDGLPGLMRRAEHKYSGGVTWIIAGSEGLTGAANLAARSAWATGAGAVILVTPRGLLPLYEQSLPQIIKKGIGKSDERGFHTGHVSEILQLLKVRQGSLLIGPGLGKGCEEWVSEVLMHFTGRVVIDADAIRALENAKRPQGSEWVVTPHPGELERWVGKSADDGLERMTIVRKIAEKRKIWVLSKGYPTILASPDGEIQMTGYDTRVFARAGFGDVLAGGISGYLCFSNEISTAIIRCLLEGASKVARHLEQNPGSPPEPKTLL
ncbi:MAG: NAD(P)H-hydrate epimerase [Balneolaceae bacterium]